MALSAQLGSAGLTPEKLETSATVTFDKLEAGWTVTEVGRQPWIIYGLMRTSEAVTPMPGLVVPMTLFTLLYLGLGAIVATLITSLVRETAEPAR